MAAGADATACERVGHARRIPDCAWRPHRKLQHPPPVDRACREDCRAPGGLEETISGPPVSAAFSPDGSLRPPGWASRKNRACRLRSVPRNDSEGEYLAFHKRQRGKSAGRHAAGPPWLRPSRPVVPKQMHWDAKLDDDRGELLFGRPIRWLLFLYGGRVVPFRIGRTPGAAGAKVLDVESGPLTYGHRFLARADEPAARSGAQLR